MNNSIRLLIPVLALLPLFTTAQTYYYVDNISVVPSAPTTSDPVTVTLIGSLSATNSFIVGVSHSVVGFAVHITVDAGSSGIGSPTIMPHNESFDLGTLPAGTYTIDITGSFTSDFAPTPEHQFVVSGGGSPCDSVIVDYVQWAPFSDDAIEVHVFNNSSELFDYPGWVLFDSGGDTLAKEVVNFFGIASESWHTLNVHPGATIPIGPFSGSIELWTWFYDTLACEFNINTDLCPPAPCQQLMPTMQNTGGALVVANVPWMITSDGTPVGSGTFDLTSLEQYDTDTLCLPPGHYLMTVSYPTPLGGAVSYHLATGNPWASTIPVPFAGSGGSTFEFDFYPACFEGTEAINETVPVAEIDMILVGQQLQVTSSDGAPLGHIEVIDASGRTVRELDVKAASTVIDMTGHVPGLYVLRAGGGRVAVRPFVLPY